MTDAPYVFISYSQESDEHINRVMVLTQWFRQSGVEAYVDQFEESPAQGWQLWCYEQVKKASHVLVVCTETYERRVLRQEDEGVGRGATWEGAIITNEIYDRTHGQAKFIPVIFSHEDAAYVPFFLDSSTIYSVDDEEGRLDLYRRITDQPEYEPAPIGPARRLPPKELAKPQPVQPLPSAPAPARLEDVIEGTWVVQIQTLWGNQTMRISLTKGPFGGGQFQAAVIVGPPGWQATGNWQILPGEQIVLQGTQMVSQPFPQPTMYQVSNQFFSITPSELHGTSSAGEPVTWRRA